MIKLDFSDEELSNSTKRMISSMLPHENYNSKFFTDALTSIRNTFELEELPIDYWMLVKVLYDVFKIKVSIDEFKPLVYRDSLSSILTSSAEQFLHTNSFYVKEWVKLNSGELDLANPEQVRNTCILMTNSCLNLYDECFNMAVPSDQLPLLVVALKNAFKFNAVTESLKTQYEIYDRGVRVGRRNYLGVDGVIDYTTGFNTDINTRLNNMESDVIVLDDQSKLQIMNKKNKTQSQKICDWGIPQLDDVTPILRSRLVTIAANPNVGKTLFACNITSKLIFNGAKVVYMHGESSDNKIKNNVSSNHIYRDHGKFVSAYQISGQSPCSEEAQRLINISDLEITNTKNLTFKKTFTYDNLYNELKSLYESSKFDVVIFDHSLSMTSAPGSKLFTPKQRVDSAVMQARDFKNDYPVCIIYLSHLSVEAQNDLRKHGRVFTSSPTRESGVLAPESDELFVLYNTETLSATNMIGMQVYKRRDKEAPKNDILFKLRKDVVDFEYKDEYQKSSNAEIAKDEALNNIANLMSTGMEDDLLEANFIDDED